MMANPLPERESNRVQPGSGSSEQILAAVELELSAHRTRRDAGHGVRTLLRVFGFLLLFGLFAAGLGAMWYLQTLARPPRQDRQPAGVTSQAP